MQKADYYIVVDGDRRLCDHLHPDYAGAMACAGGTDAGHVLRVSATAPRNRLRPHGGIADRGLTPVRPAVLEDRGRSTRSFHASAIVSPTARIDEDVEIGPFAIVGEEVEIGAESKLRSHCVVRDATVLGRGTIVDSFAVLGGDPQVQKFDPAIPSSVEAGDRVVFREGVTVHRSTKPGGVTRIGPGATLMANSHVGHDCEVGSNAILANNVMLGGHVEIGPYAFLGGGAGVHQFVRIGEGAMIAGNAAITYDIPPFMLASGRNEIHGLNIVGLQRRQFSEPVINDLKLCYRVLFSERSDLRRGADAAIRNGTCGSTGPGRQLLDFFAAGVRGFARPSRRVRPGLDGLGFGCA